LLLLLFAETGERGGEFFAAATCIFGEALVERLDAGVSAFRQRVQPLTELQERLTEFAAARRVVPAPALRADDGCRPSGCRGGR
jgi:hypothetical protein